MTDLIIDESPKNNTLKRCTKCGELKPATLDNFQAQKTGKGGLHSRCRVCLSDYAKQWRENNRDRCRENEKRWQEENRERFHANVKRWQKENPDRVREQARRWREKNAEWVLERTRRWREKNRDALRKRLRRWQLENPERCREISRRWVRLNPDKVRELSRVNSRNRRAFKLKSGGTHTAADIHAQLKYQNGKCYHCGKKIKGKYHVDHLIALKLGGSNGPENLVVACPKCNLSKSAMSIDEWNKRRGRLL